MVLTSDLIRRDRGQPFVFLMGSFEKEFHWVYAPESPIGEGVNYPVSVSPPSGEVVSEWTLSPALGACRYRIYKTVWSLGRPWIGTLEALFVDPFLATRIGGEKKFPYPGD